MYINVRLEDINMIQFALVFLWNDVIVAIYVDDLNIIGTPEEFPKAVNCLKKEFELKNLGKTKFCFELQIEHLKDGILVIKEIM
jgi:hypothetical protein